jgi:hypothetical protein
MQKLLELRKKFGADKPLCNLCPVLSELQTDEKPSPRPALERSEGTTSMGEQELTELIAKVTASVLREL